MRPTFFLKNAHLQIQNNIKSSNIKDSHPGFTLDPVSSIQTEDIKLGGESISSHLEQGFSLNDFEPYLPININKIKESKIETKFLGYYLITPLKHSRKI